MSGVAAHVRDLVGALGELEAEAGRIERWGGQLGDLLARGGRVLVAGNGGSAALAEHLSSELVGRYVDERRPLSGIALTADSPASTAIANDYGFEEVFSRQVRAHGRAGDILLLLTTSGRSRNLLAAASAGKERDLIVWALTGALPNPLADRCDDVIAVSGSTATVQEAQQVIVHLLCGEIDRAVGAQDGEGP